MADGIGSAFGRFYSARATDKGGNLVKMYSNPDTGEWSIVIVRPDDNLACVMLNGDRWEVVLEEDEAI